MSTKEERREKLREDVRTLLVEKQLVDVVDGDNIQLNPDGVRVLIGLLAFASPAEAGELGDAARRVGAWCFTILEGAGSL